MSLWWLLSLAHLLGLGLGLGAATVKLVLAIAARRDPSLVPSYLAVTKPVTKVLLVGMLLLTASGVTWVVLGTPWTPLLVAKVSTVVAIWVLGPVIDKVLEPRLARTAAGPGGTASREFGRAQRQHLAVEGLATGLFYVAAVLGSRF